MSRLMAVEVNPYLNQTHWEIKGSFFQGAARLSEHLEGRPMSEWLTARRTGYQRWDGFLPEVMRELNEDELEILFLGIPEDWEVFQRALHLQESDVERMGFSSGSYEADYVEKFLPDQVQEALLAHRRGVKSRAAMVPPTQELLMRMDELDAQLFAREPADVALLTRLYMGYTQVYSACADACGDARHSSWLKNLSDVKRIFG